MDVTTGVEHEVASMLISLSPLFQLDVVGQQ
jgi:hypothetical protein